MPSTFRRIGASAFVVTLALALGGCFAVESFEVAQQGGTGGPVQLVAVVCDESSSGGPCLSTFDENPEQLLAAYLLPTSVDVTSVVATGAYRGTFARDESYENFLNGDEPPPEGRRWSAFRVRVTADPDDTTERIRVDARVALPGQADQPLASLPHQIRIGQRDDGSDPDRDVNCAASDTECVFGARNDELATRDAQLVKPERTDADAGASTTIEVPVRYGGPDDSGELKPSATSTLPGATFTGEPISFGKPATKRLALRVAVPFEAAPGDYDVAVSLALPGGVTRKVTAPLRVVTPVAPVPDNAQLAFTPTEIGRAAHLDVRLTVPDGGRRAALRAPVVAGAHPGEFAVVADECSSGTLEEDQNCRIGVDFLPAAGGTRSAILRIPYAGGTIEVPLGGTGLPALDAVRAALRRATSSGDLERGLTVVQDVQAPGTVSLRLRLLPEGSTAGGGTSRAAQETAAPQGVLVGRRVVVAVTEVGRQTMRIPFTAAGRRAIRARRGVRLMLTTALTDVRGRRVVVRVPLRLRP